MAAMEKEAATAETQQADAASAPINPARVKELTDAVVSAGNEVRRLKTAKEDFSDALKLLVQAKDEYKRETGKTYEPPGGTQKSRKQKKQLRIQLANEKALRAAKAAEEQRQRKAEERKARWQQLERQREADVATMHKERQGQDQDSKMDTNAAQPTASSCAAVPLQKRWNLLQKALSPSIAEEIRT